MLCAVGLRAQEQASAGLAKVAASKVAATNRREIMRAASAAPRFSR
jgi:hypothetical protein